MAIGFLPGYGRQSALIGQMQADPLQTGLISPAVLAAMAEPQGKVRSGLLSADTWNRIGDGLAGAENTGADRRGLLGQALLAAGAGMMQTGGQGFMGALGTGLATGLEQLNAGRDSMANARYKQMLMASQGGDPAGLREFNELTRIASDPNETQERRQAASVRLGMTGRASSAGYSLVKFTGADGRPRVGTLNGQTGQIDTPDGMSFSPGSVQITGMGAPDYTPAAPTQRAANGEQVRIDPSVPAWLREQILANPDAVEYNQPGTFTPAPAVPRATNPSAWAGPTAAEEAAAVASAQRGVELSTLPTELDIRTRAAVDQAGQVAAATDAVKVGSDAMAKQVERDATFRLYEAAIQGASEGLAGTTTGPIAGRLPAVTAAQQTAEGGVAAMAPVLKQLFRTAGEGTFTDKDQELLLKMVPTRMDLPEARDAKLANIDRIVRAKLGQSGAARPAATPPPAAGGGRPTGPAGGRTIQRTGTMNGRRVVQYSDGSVEYAD